MVYRCYSQENDLCPYNASQHTTTGHRNYMPDWMLLPNITSPTIDVLKIACANGTECADMGECNSTAISGESDMSMVCCSGAQSCVHSPTISTRNNDIRCDAVSSCADTYIDSSSGSYGDVYLTASYSGYQSEILTSAAGSIFCSARFSCLDANIHDALNLYSLGKDSTSDSTIRDVDNIYAYGFETMSSVTITSVKRLMANAYSAVSESVIDEIGDIYAWARYALDGTTITGLYGGVNAYMQYALNEIGITGDPLYACNWTQSVYVNCEYVGCGFRGTFRGIDYGSGYWIFRGTLSNDGNDCASEENGGSSLTCIGTENCKAATIDGVTNITASGLESLANDQIMVH